MSTLGVWAQDTRDVARVNAVPPGQFRGGLTFSVKAPHLAHGRVREFGIDTPPTVLGLRLRLQMRRADAPRVPAQVIDHHASRHFAPVVE